MDLLFATIDNGCYGQYLGRCGLDVRVEKPEASPAAIYNRVLRETKERYVCFIHADVTCRGLAQAIEDTIRERPGYLLGAVGANNGYIWSRGAALFDLVTADSCCLVVDREMGIRFDAQTFNGFHLYVEDACMAAGKVSTIYIDAYDGLRVPGDPGGDYLIHHSHTFRRLGARWGDYNQYHKRLLEKWPGAQTT